MVMAMVMMDKKEMRKKGRKRRCSLTGYHVLSNSHCAK